MVLLESWLEILKMQLYWINIVFYKLSPLCWNKQIVLNHRTQLSTTLNNLLLKNVVLLSEILAKFLKPLVRLQIPKHHLKLLKSLKMLPGNRSTQKWLVSNWLVQLNLIKPSLDTNTVLNKEMLLKKWSKPKLI